MKPLNLNILHDGSSTGLSVRYGGFLAEAASVCLESHNHSLRIPFDVDGDLKESYELIREEVNQSAANSFADLEEATQFGAMGVAVLMIYDLTSWKVKRSWKGTGFDFWVGYDEAGSPFQNKLRLEISGDLTGSINELQTRLKQKLNQTSKSDSLEIPACAVIVEFSSPKSLTGMR
jgi:hypothetical protein